MSKQENLKKLVLLSVCLSSVAMVTACSSTEKTESKTNVEDSSQNEEVESSSTTKGDTAGIRPSEEINTNELEGTDFVKSVRYDSLNGYMEFLDSYEEFQTAYPDVKLTKETYDAYFNDEVNVQKMLVHESVRMLRNNPDTETLFVTLTTNTTAYKMELKYEELTKFLGFDVRTLIEEENLSETEDAWKQQFVEKYVNNEEGRTNFFQTFVKVE
ncbi:hypothetical protein CVD28_00670 [Bacillus sp. M6-12]|uniref:hypothetical protein n=1 Tax=Bacillus sp. M6-12 TaxID=2054166 RepID=UPI000C75BA2E|nr:hypothetical protein [Bacillus sp. M6-12]PLS18946.1 hypothetical protein CVD28_00670 [Bacillus sp. M6-12]